MTENKVVKATARSVGILRTSYRAAESEIHYRAQNASQDCVLLSTSLPWAQTSASIMYTVLLGHELIASLSCNRPVFWIIIIQLHV